MQNNVKTVGIMLAIVLVATLVAVNYVEPMLNDSGAEFDVVTTTADIEISEAQPICTASRSQIGVEIYGDNIVWSDYRNNNWNMYGYNLDDQEEYLISDHQTDEIIGGIYENRVAYRFLNESTNLYDIAFYYLNNQTNVSTLAKSIYGSIVTADSATYCAYTDTDPTQRCWYITSPTFEPVKLPGGRYYQTTLAQYEENLLIASYSLSIDGNIYTYTYDIRYFNLLGGNNFVVASTTYSYDVSQSPKYYGSGSSVLGGCKIVDENTIVYARADVGGQCTNDYFNFAWDFYKYDIQSRTSTLMFSDLGYFRASEGRDGLYSYTIQPTDGNTPADMYLVKVDTEDIYQLNLNTGYDEVKDISIYHDKVVFSAQDCTANSDEYNNIYMFTLSGSGVLPPPTEDDEDGDGLPDEWEEQIIDDDPDDDIETIEDVKPNDDYDEDGFTNKEEYEADTDPTDPDDFPEPEPDTNGGIDTNILIAIVVIAGLIVGIEGVYFKFSHFKNLSRRTNIGLILSIIIIILILIWWIVAGF